MDGRSLTRESRHLRSRLSDERDAAFANACVYGVLRNYFSLDVRLRRLLEKPLRRKDADVEMLLLAALFQMTAMQVPQHALVSAHVEAARELGKPWATRLVNAILRRALREEAVDVPATPDRNHPAWLAARIRADWPDDWAAILDANNQHAPLTLRVNTRRISRGAYLEQLAAAGLDAQPTSTAAEGIHLVSAVQVERLPGFADGLVSVQDEAAQLAAELLELDGNLRVLDACAAPGGKTGHMLERLNGRGHLTALDQEPERLREVGDNLARLGLTCEQHSADAGSTAWWDGTPFDRILLDAPCSAFGVIRRHPDIRFHRTSDDLQMLAAEQTRLLTALWPLLGKGGKLVYATCSIVPAENDDIIDGLLATQTNAEVEAFSADWGRPLRHGRQILPGEHAMDGFYYARLRKRG